MNKYFTDKMNEAWRDWHRGIEEEFIPESPNPSFHRGFSAAINIVIKAGKAILAGAEILRVHEKTTVGYTEC